MKYIRLLLLLIVLAGCSADPSSTPNVSPSKTVVQTTDEVTDQDSQTATLRESPTRTPSPTATPTSTPVPSQADNPWQSYPVTVAIGENEESGRAYEEILRKALTYWEKQDANHTAYNVTFEIVPAPSRADIIVDFVDTISSCGEEEGDDIAGCAPIYEDRRAYGQTHIQVETQYNDRATLTILKHELGHTLGLRHSYNDTLAFMATGVSLGKMPAPDVDERDYKWYDYTVEVYADLEDVSPHARDRVRDEIESVVHRYNSFEHEKLPGNVTLTMVSDPEQADIIVHVVDDTPSGRYSDVRLWGLDTDKDGELEYNSYMDVYVKDEYHDQIGEYVGFYVGYALYADEDHELPGPYRP